MKQHFEPRRPPLRLKASDPAYKKINEMASTIALGINEHMVLFVERDLPQAEMEAALQSLKDEMGQWVDAGAFANYLSEHDDSDGEATE